MIRQHDFNSNWWGAPVGIVSDPQALQRAPLEEVAAAAAAYKWVVLRGLADAGLDSVALAARGFLAVDSQVRFRIGLRRLQSTPSIDRLRCRFADDEPFEVDVADIPNFVSERFRVLPGADDQRIRQRYALWSEVLLAECPERCMRVLSDGEVQGYFLSRQTREGLNLTLAMLRPSATVTGMHLFHKALLAYAGRGVRLGHASFSVANTPVMNIYSSLGARFMTPESFWFRIAASEPVRTPS